MSKSNPPWKKLVDELVSLGHHSPHLERLRQRYGRAYDHAGLEQEIASEMAAALGQSEEKLLVALLEVERAGLKLGRARPGAEYDALADRFNELRRDALRRRWELQIHREALGFLRNQVLEELYPVPPAVPRPGRP
ncbi:MAG TPA: hypothetical protein VFS00_01650 [Polyangiaceae bacterium]|nr:hypothetical protein [Polyangiaceae bacterium]